MLEKCCRNTSCAHFRAKLCLLPSPRFDSFSPRNAKTRRLSVAEPEGRVSALGLAGVFMRCVRSPDAKDGASGASTIKFYLQVPFPASVFLDRSPRRRDVCAPFSARLTRGRKKARRRRARSARRRRPAAKNARLRNRRTRRRRPPRSTGIFQVLLSIRLRSFFELVGALKF